MVVIKSSRGSSEFLILMILAGISSMVYTQLTIAKYMNDGDYRQKSNYLHKLAELVKNNVIEYIDNSSNWTSTQSSQETDAYLMNDGVFDCLKNKNCAHSKPLDPNNQFVLRNYLKQDIVNNWDPTLGFAWDGTVCHTFNAATGDDDCPFRFENLRWYADCHTESNWSLCLEPKINVRGDFVFKPASARYTAIPFNPLRYSLDYTRAPTTQSTLFTQSKVVDIPAAIVPAAIDGPTYPDPSGDIAMPVGAVQMSIEIWGGGGGGGGGGSGIDLTAAPIKDHQVAGGGGGGAGYVRRTIPVSPGATYNLTLGLGGLGGSAGQDGHTGGDTIAVVKNPVGSNYTLTALGGKGGEHCLSFPCTAITSSLGTGLGNGGNGQGGSSVKDGIPESPQDVVISKGKKGQKYNAVKDDHYHSETSNEKTMIINFGGRGGDSGGGQGAGGAPNATLVSSSYTLPSVPGGGGAGTQDRATIKPQAGANGKAIIWFGF